MIGYKRPLAKVGQQLMTRLIGTSVDNIREAARLVLEGGLIAYPTDTVYGLGCNPFDAAAVDRLVKAKDRIKGSLPILESGGAIVGTSANISGHRSLSTAEEVLSELGGRIDLVLDGGPTLLGRESTVVRIIGDEITVLREAAISRDDILKALSVTRAC